MFVRYFSECDSITGSHNRKNQQSVVYYGLYVTIGVPIIYFLR